MELMSYNMRSNATLYPNCPPTALPLDWDEELPETVRDFRDRGGFDLVVMADVTYNTSSFPALLRTLASLLELNTRGHRHHRDSSRDGISVAEEDADPSRGTRHGGKREREHEHERDSESESEPLVLLAYKERDPAERQLWDMMARETGVVLECVGKQAGGGGLPVEVWLGRRRSSS